ncbi:MAG: Gfo/Idh/MocA family protein [Eubacteriales bacterium]
MKDTVRWGVIGAGGIADRRTIPGMQLAGNAVLTAVMETGEAAAEKLRVKYGALRAYTDWRALLDDDSVDAVYIASPVMYHEEQAIAAAEAGKHILLEKPAALTSAGCRRIMEACDKNRIIAVAGFMMRYHACHMKMKELIASGALGQIVSGRAQLTCWYPETEGAWRQRKQLSGGGALMDLGIHCIDLIEYITGSKTADLCGFTDTRTFTYDADDSSDLLIKLENGAVAYIDSHFNIPDDAAFCRLEIYGTGGSMTAEGTIGQNEAGSVKVVLSDTGFYDPQQNRIRRDTRSFMLEPASLPGFGNMYTKEIESVGHSILLGEPVKIPLSDALHVQDLIEAAYKQKTNYIKLRG